jgi:hypothetical protein
MWSVWNSHKHRDQRGMKHYAGLDGQDSARRPVRKPPATAPPNLLAETTDPLGYGNCKAVARDVKKYRLMGHRQDNAWCLVEVSRADVT